MTIERMLASRRARTGQRRGGDAPAWPLQPAAAKRPRILPRVGRDARPHLEPGCSATALGLHIAEEIFTSGRLASPV